MLDVRLEFDEWLEKVFALAREHIAHPLWEPLSTLQMPDVYWAILACRLDSTDTLVARLPLNRTLVAQMDEGQRLYQLCRQEPDFGAAEPPSVIVRRLEDISPKLSDTALVAACCAAESAWRARETLIRYAQKWRHVHPVTTGNDLIAMGLRPGPLFGRLLTRLRDYWLDGRITDPAHERQYLERWLSGTGAEEEHDGH